MTNIITGPGEYRTADDTKAVVEYVNDAWAFGHALGLERERYTCIWHKITGTVEHHHGGRLDIIGPFVSPRKRVSGFVAVRRDTGEVHVDSDFYKLPAFVWNHFKEEYVDAVPVRSYDPEAEKEARAKFAKWERRGTDGTYMSLAEFMTAFDELRNAIRSLLFPDEAQ